MARGAKGDGYSKSTPAQTLPSGLSALPFQCTAACPMYLSRSTRRGHILGIGTPEAWQMRQAGHLQLGACQRWRPQHHHALGPAVAASCTTHARCGHSEHAAQAVAPGTEATAAGAFPPAQQTSEAIARADGPFCQCQSNLGIKCALQAEPPT